MDGPSKRAPKTAATDGRARRSDDSDDAGSPARRGTAATARTLAGTTAPRQDASTRQQQTTDPSAALPIIAELSPTGIAEFIDTVTATGDGDEPDPTLWGPPPPTAEPPRHT